jgi:hypothetical protein
MLQTVWNSRLRTLQYRRARNCRFRASFDIIVEARLIDGPYLHESAVQASVTGTWSIRGVVMLYIPSRSYTE